MKNIWRDLPIKIFFWLAIEIFLNFIGIDQLADYGEFISNRDTSYNSVGLTCFS